MPFEVLGNLAKVHHANDLSQGFPDWDTPRFIQQAMIDAVQNEENQYVRPQGHPALCEQIASHYSLLFGR